MVSLSGILNTVTSPAVDAYNTVKDGAVDGYNIVKNGAVDTFQSVLNDAKNGYNALNNATGGSLLDRGLGVLQAGAGVVESGVGVVGGVLTSETGIGAVLGGGLALHGFDDIQAGARQALTGKPTETFTQQAVTSLAQHVGASPVVAAGIGIGIDIAAGGGVGGLRKGAIEGTEAAIKGAEGAGKTTISMEEAIDRAIAHSGGDASISVSSSGGFQLISSTADANGNIITRISRLDINPNSAHVQKLGPHLNLETQINGITVRSGPLADPHTPINPATIRPGDVP
jgi:hypothetical protein